MSTEYRAFPELDSSLRRVMVPGLTGAIADARMHDVSWQGSVGSPGLGYRRFTTRYRFSLGSQARLLVRILMLCLVENGQVELDDRASSYVPELRFKRSQIKLRDLLTQNELLLPRGLYVHRDAARGSLDSNTRILALVCESATGSKLPSLLAHYIFGPLELNGTRVSSHLATRGAISSKPTARQSLTTVSVVSTIADLTTLFVAIHRGSLHPSLRDLVVPPAGQSALGLLRSPLDCDVAWASFGASSKTLTCTIGGERGVISLAAAIARGREEMCPTYVSLLTFASNAYCFLSS